MQQQCDADVLIVGAGIAGLVAACELADAGKRVIVVDQEPEQNLGGQAFWSFGGLFLVNSPEQRRLGIRDSYALAYDDWMDTAGFDRPQDHWPRQWAEAYLAFAAGEKRTWLRDRGVRFFPIVAWAERGGYGASGPGNSVPRFHTTWGTGPGLLDPFVQRVREAVKGGLITLEFRHRVTALTQTGGVIDGVHGDILEPSSAARGAPTSGRVVDEFTLRGQAVIVAAGGMGGNHHLVRQNWPQRLGKPPEHMLRGVPEHVDGTMLSVTEATGGQFINPDRMWHYTEGVHRWDPVWRNHGVRISPGPSSFWLDANGHRLPAPHFPGFDTLGSMEQILKTGHGHSWFILNQRILKKEFILAGSDQNPGLTNKSIRQVLGRIGPAAPAPVEAFKQHSPDFLVANNLADLVGAMNDLTESALLDFGQIEREIMARDRQLNHYYNKDLQISAIHNARAYLPDKFLRVAKPHKLLDPKAGPLIAVRLHILTRKTLGGLKTDLSGRVLQADDQPVPGLFAAGEAAGFGGGGMHGYRALEGTFLGGCLFSGRIAGRCAAEAVV